MSLKYDKDEYQEDDESLLLITKQNTKNYEILSNSLPDVHLICKSNNKIFKAHKIILDKNCTKLRSICLSNDKIYLNSSEDSVAYLLLHLYIPPLKLNDDNLLDCALISKEMGCLSLAFKIKRYIKRYLNNLSLISSLLSIDKLSLYTNICDELNFIQLYNSLLELLKCNISNLLNDEFNFVNLNINTLRCIVKHAKNTCISHFKLFIKIYKWILHDSSNREEYTQELLLNVEFNLINVSNLIEIEHNFKDIFENYSLLNDKFYDAMKNLALKGKLKNDNLNTNSNNNNNNNDYLEKRLHKADILLIVTNFKSKKSNSFLLLT
jgi:hypothetical protein